MMYATSTPAHSPMVYSSRPSVLMVVVPLRHRARRRSAGARRTGQRQVGARHGCSAVQIEGAGGVAQRQRGARDLACRHHVCRRNRLRRAAAEQVQAVQLVQRWAEAGVSEPPEESATAGESPDVPVSLVSFYFIPFPATHKCPHTRTSRSSAHPATQSSAAGWPGRGRSRRRGGSAQALDAILRQPTLGGDGQIHEKGNALRSVPGGAAATH